VFTDTLPVNSVFWHATPNCALHRSEVVCAVGSLASGATATITIAIVPKSAGALANSARVTASEADIDMDNNRVDQAIQSRYIEHLTFIHG
jgi:Domain of unknown function DUF11